jgi:hypothetical protein
MIRQLRDDDAQSYADLWRQALLEAPLAFVSSPEDDCASSAEGRCANCCGRRSEMFNKDAALVPSELGAPTKLLETND